MAAPGHDGAERPAPSFESAGAPDTAGALRTGTAPPPDSGRLARPENAGPDAVPETDPAVAAPDVAPSEAPGAASTAPAPEPRRPPVPTATTEPVGLLSAPAAAGTGRAAEAPAVSAASDTSPATPAAVADQIVSAVVPLHGRGDGRHEVTLELRPESLGAIRVELSVEHQTVHLTLHAAEPATGGLLSAALPDLRAALADAGLTAGHIGVGPGGQGAGHRRPPAGEGGNHRTNRRPDREPAEPVRPVRPAAAGRLDVLL